MEYTLTSPMLGLCARTTCNPGDTVEVGQELVVINCMKMETSCKSEKAGVVKEVLVKEWDELAVGTPMVIIEVK